MTAGATDSDVAVVAGADGMVAAGTTTGLAREAAWHPQGRARDWGVLRQLVTKDFKLKYRRSALGVAWSVLNPLLMMLVMAAVFGSFMRYSDPTLGNYPVYLILGNTAFQLMNDATSQGMSSIIMAAPLLKKVKINRYVFPVQKVLSAGVNYAFSLIAIALVMLVEGVPLTPYALLLPVAVLLLIVFCIGLSLLLSAASVFFRDVMHLWSVVTIAWTYATPIFYPYAILPDWMKLVEAFNPMYAYITLIRDSLLWAQLPEGSLLASALVWALVSLSLGVFVFRKTEHKFILFI